MSGKKYSVLSFGELKTKIRFDHKLILMTAFISALSSWVDSKEVCVAFRENDDKISYLYSRGFKNEFTSDLTKQELIINGHYWTIHLTDHEKVKKLTFPSLQSKKCPLFSNNYSMAVDVRTGDTGWKNSRAFLFSGNDWNQVTVGHIPDDQFTNYEELTKFEFIGNKSLKGDVPKDAFIAFGEGIKESKSRVMFVQRKGSKYEVNGYHIEEVGDGFTMEKINEDFDNMNAIRALSVSSNLIGVHPRWSNKQNKYGLILLFGDGPKIKWCWTLGTDLDKEKCETDVELLRNCSYVTRKPTPTQKVEQKEGISVGLILIIIIVIVVIIVILIAMYVYFVRNKMSTEEEILGVKRNVSTTARKSVLSTKSADIKGPKPPTSKTGSSKAVSKSPKAGSAQSSSGSAVKSAAK